MSARGEGGMAPAKRVRGVLTCALCACACVALALGAKALFVLAMARLTDAWGVTAENIARAPAWTRVFLMNWDVCAAILQYAALGVTALAARRVMLRRPLCWVMPAFYDALIPALTLTGLFLFDEIRLLSWRGASWSFALTLVYTLARALAAELLLRGLLQEGAGVWAGVAGGVALALLSGSADAWDITAEILVCCVCAAETARGRGIVRCAFFRWSALLAPDALCGADGGAGLARTVFVGGRWVMTAAVCAVTITYLAVISRKEARAIWRGHLRKMAK